MLWNKSESNDKPAETEAVSGGRYYVRQNIHQEERPSQNGGTVKVWVYDESLIDGVEYAAWSAVSTAELKREAEIIDEYTLQLIEEGSL